MSTNQQISDFIFFYPEALNKKTCDLIINYYDPAPIWKPSTFYNGKETSGTSQVVMDDYWMGKPSPYFKEVASAFANCMADYAKISKRLQYDLQFTDFRLNRYKEGGFMNEHIDSIHHSHGQKEGYPHLTALIFLNDDYEGGEFVICGESLKKEQGSAIVFPSNFMYPHEVKEVTKGKRFSVMTWIM